jgi:AbrB family looped-hinge helix DNA binding protein
MNDQVTVSAQYRITIPKAVGEQAGIRPGQHVTFLVMHGVIHVVPVLSIEQLQEIFRGMNIEGYREEVDRY